MIAHARKLFRMPRWVRFAVSAVLLAVVLASVDIAGVGSALSGADVLFVGLLLCTVYAERLYSALRWHQVLRWSGARVPLMVVVRLSFVSAFAGLFLPGALGVEAIRIVGLARYSADLSLALSSVLIDRMVAVLTLVPLVLLGLAFAPGDMPRGISITAIAALAAVICLAFVLMHSWPQRIAPRVLPGAMGRLLLPHFQRLHRAFALYRERPAMFLLALCMGIGFQFMRVLVVWLSALAVGIDVSPAYHFVFAPIIAMVSMAPISFAGIGAREAAYVYLFSLLGVPAEQAIASSILVQFVGLLSCLPGAIAYARGSSVRRQPEGERACVGS